MWDFLLVLGEVPGTDFRITFAEILIFCLFISLIWLARKRLLSLKPTQYLQAYRRQLFAKKGQQLKLPV